MTITTAQLDNIKGLITRIDSQASPELKGILDQLMWDLNNGDFLDSESIGIAAFSN